MVTVQINNPIKAQCFLLLSKKLSNAKKKEAMIVAVSNTAIDLPVYTARNSGEVSHSGNIKQKTARKESRPRKIET